MLKNLFTKESLSILVNRIQDKKIRLSISSDYSGSSRKSQLYVNEERLSSDIESCWKNIKTKKLLSMSLSFSEIDWYDDMTDIYDTPIIRIERGLKKPRISHNEHGSIPKDWSVEIAFIFADTTTNTPIIEVVEKTLGGYFDTEVKKELIKALKPFLQKKVNYANYEVEYQY